MARSISAQGVSSAWVKREVGVDGREARRGLDLEAHVAACKRVQGDLGDVEGIALLLPRPGRDSPRRWPSSGAARRRSRPAGRAGSAGRTSRRTPSASARLSTAPLRSKRSSSTSRCQGLPARPPQTRATCSGWSGSRSAGPRRRRGRSRRAAPPAAPRRWLKRGGLDQVREQRAPHARRSGSESGLASRSGFASGRRLGKRASMSSALEGEVDRLGKAAGGQVVADLLAQDLARRLRRVEPGERGQGRGDVVEAVDAAGPPRRGPARRPLPSGRALEVEAAPGRDGHVPDLPSPSAPASKPRPVSQRSTSAVGTRRRRRRRAARGRAGPGGPAGSPRPRRSIAPARTVPPAISAIRAAARLAASQAELRGRRRARSGGWRRCACRGLAPSVRTCLRSKWAPSIRMSRRGIRDLAVGPPMTPARPTGRSASAITSISGSSLRSTPSRVVRRSPAAAPGARGAGCPPASRGRRRGAAGRSPRG